MPADSSSSSSSSSPDSPDLTDSPDPTASPNPTASPDPAGFPDRTDSHLSTDSYVPPLEYHFIKSSELIDLLQSDTPYLVVDMRTDSEKRTNGQIPLSLSLEQFNKTPSLQDGTHIVFYCQHGFELIFPSRSFLFSFSLSLIFTHIIPYVVNAEVCSKQSSIAEIIHIRMFVSLY